MKELKALLSSSFAFKLASNFQIAYYDASHIAALAESNVKLVADV